MKLWAVVVVAAGVCLAQMVLAQVPAPALRDPTLAPAATVGGVAESGPLGAADLPLRLNGSNVVVRNGKPMLVVGTRLVAPGQTVESYRLERITETEIWLRDANGLTKVPRFAGVQRQLAVSQCPGARPTVAPEKKAVKKSTPRTRTMARPPGPKAGTGAPRPTRENDLHDC